VPMVSMDHLHAPAVSVKEQAGILVIALRRSRTSTFRQLVADCEGTLVVVARFLALLELYREGAVTFDQMDPLGELHIRWTGTDDGEVDVEDEFDDVPPPEGAADPPPDDAVPLEVAEADQPDDVRPQQPQESATDD